MKKCVHCDKPSIPGLKPGPGLCQYHWNVAAYGREWADDVARQAGNPARTIAGQSDRGMMR
jgi:hypothetical protein